jgi:bifunctional oligoribonuclease and PAP phosphatase NrnA
VIETLPAHIAGRLAAERDIVVMSHESPDGDAIGAVVALVLVARNLGIACRAYLPGAGPLPPEYAFLPIQGEILRGDLPTLGDSALYVLDCATPDRVSREFAPHARRAVNIDHHNDNAGWGEVNLVDPGAASTTEILFRVMGEGGLSLDREIATALYVGLVTDTGRFQYANTTPRGHRMAAALQELGVDVNAVYRQVYSSYPPGKLRLLGRALERLTLLLDGRLVVSWLDLDDMSEVGGEDSYAEGIIDSLRAVEGARVAALLRERRHEGGIEIKVSLRSTDGAVDVSSIAHLWEGGGHVQAAGFTSQELRAAVIHGIERETLARL